MARISAWPARGIANAQNANTSTVFFIMLSKIRGDVSFNIDLPLLNKRTSNNSLYSGKRLLGHYI
jgi:hypothetical protein